MKEKDTIEALARSYAAHGIKTAADVAAYCRPPLGLRVGLSLVLGIVGGAFAPLAVPGVGVAGCLLAGSVAASVALLASSAFVALMDNI